MDSFHLFPYLPFELRAQIWELTVEPRTVEVRIAYRHVHVPWTRRKKRQPRPKTEFQRLFTPTPVPAPLQTCREARNLGLYQQALSELCDDPEAGRRYVWLNLDIDIVSIETCYFESFKAVAPQIKRLKFERDHGCEFFFHSEVRELRYFTNVEEIHVICGDGFRMWNGAGDHYWPCGNENVHCTDPGEFFPPMTLPELEAVCDALLEEGYKREDEELARREAEELERRES